MSAASFATSVPLSTEMPTSAWWSASASLTPSPRNATSAPVRALAPERSVPSSRDRRARTRSSRRCAAQARRRPCRSTVVARQRTLHFETELATHGDRDLLAVAGDDLEVDAEPRQTARSDAVALSLGPVDEDQEPDELEVVLVGRRSGPCSPGAGRAATAIDARAGVEQARKRRAARPRSARRSAPARPRARP